MVSKDINNFKATKSLKKLDHRVIYLLPGLIHKGFFTRSPFSVGFFITKDDYSMKILTTSFLRIFPMVFLGIASTNLIFLGDFQV